MVNSDISHIHIHDDQDFLGMRKAGKLAAETLDFITPYVQPGITTEELDRLCHSFILDNNAIPAPVSYTHLRAHET